VVVAALEYPWRGDAFLLRRPGYDLILPELLDYAEETLLHRETRSLSNASPETQAEIDDANARLGDLKQYVVVQAPAGSRPRSW